MPFLWQNRCRRIFELKVKKLYFGFVDLEKAFDREPREPGSPGPKAVKQFCVCVCVCIMALFHKKHGQSGIR